MLSWDPQDVCKQQSGGVGSSNSTRFAIASIQIPNIPNILAKSDHEAGSLLAQASMHDVLCLVFRGAQEVIP
jgi:hypothetical protein